MPCKITPDMYRRYRDVVLRYSNAVQESGRRGLTIREIAEKTGLTEDQVREILSIAEKDIPLEEFEKADEFKRRGWSLIK